MKRLTRIMLILTILGSLAAMVISIWPGLLQTVAIFALMACVLVFPLFVIALIVIAVIQRRSRRSAGAAEPQRFRVDQIPIVEAALIVLIAIFTLGALRYYVPRRLAFLYSRAAFEKAAESASPHPGAVLIELHERLGVYYVDYYVMDQRGGVYFLLNPGADGIGPDRTWYGFAYRPNRERTPFGAAHYKLHYLAKDWYWFRASDDWH